MSYEDEYYIMVEPDIKHYPQLTPTLKTSAIDYHFDPIPPFSEPLFFENSEIMENKNSRIGNIIYPILMADLSFIVITDIKNHLTKNYQLKGMHFHPAVYIERTDVWHDNYWFLNIYSSIDCWDRNKSSFTGFSKRKDIPVQVEKFVLDKSILDGIDEENRLIFRMGGASGSPLFIHQRILNYFKENNITGYRVFKVSEYEFGMEF